jgi:hypothetical protein
MAFPTIWTDERRETLKRLMKSTIIAYLDTVLPPSIRAVGVSNNPRSRITGAKEKARGMRKGSPTSSSPAPITITCSWSAS